MWWMSEALSRAKKITGIGINVVVHPDVIRDVALWRQLGDVCALRIWTLEEIGRTAKELRPLFEELPQAKLCFDVAHARQVDPT
jgi:hypothetical protein